MPSQPVTPEPGPLTGHSRTDGAAIQQSLRRRVPLFADLNEDTAARLARDSVERSFAHGEHVFLEGDPADGLHILLTGLLRVWTADAEGRQLTLALLEPGDIFGEMGLIEGTCRGATVSAVRSARVMWIPGRLALDLIAREPALARVVMQGLCERLRRTNDATVAGAFVDLGHRLAKQLWELAFAVGEVSDGAARIGGVNQTDLARMLGVSREAINRRLRRLAERGLIRVEGTVIVVPDLDALRRAAERT